MTTLPILYKYTKTGAIQEWSITVDHDRFFTNEGQQNGVLTTSKPTICKGKNIGKKNQTSPFQQAQLEAQAKWQKKVDSGYNEVLSKEKKFFEPMLAQLYEDRKDLLFTVRTFIQPKLDGLRAVNQNNTLMSRNGKPYLACPHLYQDDFILDGELYSHEYKEDFNKIVSLCKKQKPTKEEIEEAEVKVEMWIYDYPGYEGKFSQRYERLKKIIGKYNQDGKSQFVLVPTTEVFSVADIEREDEKNIADGFEGSIIRLDLGPYENKRSKQLLKYKHWMDSEFELIGFEEGEGGRVDTIGKFWIRLDSSKPYNIAKKENCCKSNVKGDFDFLKEILIKAPSLIGTFATIKYFGFTPDGALRFPYIIKFNRVEYE